MGTEIKMFIDDHIEPSDAVLGFVPRHGEYITYNNLGWITVNINHNLDKNIIEVRVVKR